MFSTVPAVRAALVDLFRATLNQPDDPKVLYGHPGRHVPDRYVSVETTSDIVTREIRRLPHDLTSSVDEDYELDVIVYSLVPSRHDQDAAREAVEDVFATAQRLDDALRASQAAWTLGGLVTWAHFGQITPDDYPLNEGRASQIVASVTVKAARI